MIASHLCKDGSCSSDIHIQHHIDNPKDFISCGVIIIQRCYISNMKAMTHVDGAKISWSCFQFLKVSLV